MGQDISGENSLQESEVEAGELRTVSLSGSLFSDDLESMENREIALLLETTGVDVHLKPRWLEEKGVERD